MALEHHRLAEVERVEALLNTSGVDGDRQGNALGEQLVLTSAQYACVRILHALDLIRGPVSDGVKASMKQHKWPGLSWKANGDKIWLDRCRKLESSLAEHGVWPLQTCLAIMSVNSSVMIEAAPAGVQAASEDALAKLERSIHHVKELGRCWQWVVDGQTVETEIAMGMAAIEYVLHVLGSKDTVSLHRFVEDIQEIDALDKAVQKLDAARKNKRKEIKHDRKRMKKVFRKIDVDKSGDLDQEELAKVPFLPTQSIKCWCALYYADWCIF